jgi:hypothetical protein
MMQFLHHDFAFELDDEWWAEAGMQGFVPLYASYRVDPQAFPGKSVHEVRIDAVQPVRRRLSHGVFNDDVETGLLAKDRVIRILRGLRTNDAMPPVEIVRISSESQYKYNLTHGAHRFYLSIAAGFTHVPAVDWSTEGDS